LLRRRGGRLGGLAARPDLGLRDAGLRAIAHDVAVGAAAHDEREGIVRERLAGAGLTRDRGEPATERDLGVLDEGQVADGEAFEHGVLPRGVWALNVART